MKNEIAMNSLKKIELELESPYIKGTVIESSPGLSEKIFIDV